MRATRRAVGDGPDRRATKPSRLSLIWQKMVASAGAADRQKPTAARMGNTRIMFVSLFGTCLSDSGLQSTTTRVPTFTLL